MKKILVIYYSGVGNTRRVAELIAKDISSTYDVDIYSIERIPPNFNIEEYKAIAIGFPTIHSSPAKPIIDFLDKIPKVKGSLGVYIFTTCGLYSANALRIFALKCEDKNIIPILNSSYRCKAIDGMLLAPFMKCWFLDQKNLEEKLKRDTAKFTQLIEIPLKRIIPRVKIYSILNYPNKLAGENFKFKIHLHKDNCTKCKKCILNCPVQAFEINKENFPSINKGKCINCYRCIYGCPQSALSLSKKKTYKKLLLNG